MMPPLPQRRESSPEKSPENESTDSIDPSDAAKALGRLGGLKGGPARAEKLSPARRSEIAKKAVEARWAKAKKGEPYILKVTHGSEDHPLNVHGIEIPCFVLEGGMRVVTHRGLQRSVGMAESGGAQRIATLLRRFEDKGVTSIDLVSRIENPIPFQMPGGGPANGYEATVLADLCDVILAARKAGLLVKQQEHIAEQCEILVRGFARVGIIALVDEATGYQYYRSRRALEEILEQFVSKELVKWAKMFPDSFYQELFRLRKWTYDPKSSRRPIHAAKLTIDLVYRRLAPFVLEELQKQTPRDEKGRLKQKLFQRLTEDVGHPRLREHLASVTALMKAFDNWDQFYNKLQRVFPKFNETAMLNFPDDEEPVTASIDGPK